MPPAGRCFAQCQRQGVLAQPNATLAGVGESAAPCAAEAQASDASTAPGAATFSAKPLRAMMERDCEGRPAANCKAPIGRKTLSGLGQPSTRDLFSISL